MFETLFDIDPVAGEAELRAMVERCEQLKSAATAAQARATALWAARRRRAEQAAGVPVAQQCRGLASEVGLARRDSPARGSTHLGMARASVEEMPHTLAALESGALSEWRATLIVQQSACLSVEHRRQLDAELCGDAAGLEGWGNARVEAEAKKIAARLDAAAVVARSAKATEDRCVTIRPAPDTMTYVTALLPVAQGVALWAALKRLADTTFDGRTRGQVMADALVERVTGRPAEQPVPVALNLVLADTTLFGGDDSPGWLADYGPVPAAVVRHLVGDAVSDEHAKASLRRLYRHPRSGQLVALESQARRFPKALAAFIGLRDQTCRTPFCDAPVRHRDHADPKRCGGATDSVNGLGLCARCNYVKEALGWRVVASQKGGVHRAEFHTPTGATYRSTAPPLPGPPVMHMAEVEARITIALADPHAA